MLIISRAYLQNDRPAPGRAARGPERLLEFRDQRVDVDLSCGGELPHASVPRATGLNTSTPAFATQRGAHLARGRGPADDRVGMLRLSE